MFAGAPNAESLLLLRNSVILFNEAVGAGPFPWKFPQAGVSVNKPFAVCDGDFLVDYSGKRAGPQLFFSAILLEHQKCFISRRWYPKGHVDGRWLAGLAC